MRPGASSFHGFLGETESLEGVILDDSGKLSQIGINHEQLAEALHTVLASTREAAMRDEFGQEELMEEFGSIISPRDRTNLTAERLLQTRRHQKHILGNFYVFLQSYRGTQTCPWGCSEQMGADFNFLLFNHVRKEFVSGPGLVAHLIREHHFFEGRESPYRVDPVKLSYVLELT